MKTITYYLDKVIIGQILADGHVEKTGKNCRLSFSFGTNYEDYANWMYLILKNYCPNSVYSVLSTSKDKKYINYRLKTSTLTVFNKYRDIFYTENNGKYTKIVPNNIDKLLCPIVLAHLIMSDGTFSDSDNRIRIYTNQSSISECKMLANAITKNCNVECKVIFDRVGHSGNKQYILTIGKNQLTKLQNLVQFHMHHSMLYRVEIKSNSLFAKLIKSIEPNKNWMNCRKSCNYLICIEVCYIIIHLCLWHSEFVIKTFND